MNPMFIIFLKDILRDKNSDKFSMTKFATLVCLILFVSTIFMGLIIMWKKNEIDHWLILEIISLILTLLGYKNKFGLSRGSNGENNFSSESSRTTESNNENIDSKG